MKHLDVTTHVQFINDRDILTRKLFDVNMRLFDSSPVYKKIVLDCCNYIDWCSRTEKEGYKKPHGFSGANAGIPFNIIGIVQNRNTNKATVLVMINPVILKYDGEQVETESNCGSLTLENPIKLFRREKVLVEYYSISQQKYVQEWFDRTNGSFTIQHEIEHNLGILINNR